MPRASVGDVNRFFEYYDPRVQTLAPPVLNTWYDFCDGEDLEVWYLMIEQNNDEVAAKNLEARITIDGETDTTVQAAVSGTIYYLNLTHLQNLAFVAPVITVYAQDADQSVPVKGLDVHVEGRITEALGTNQTLDMWCKYFGRVIT